MAKKPTVKRRKKRIAKKLGIKIIRMVKPKKMTKKTYRYHCEYLAKSKNASDLMKRLDSLKTARKQ